MPDENIKEMLGLIKDGVPVVTVNTRLARYLTGLFDGMMLKEGHKAWETPFIVPFSAWTTRLWEETGPSKALISDIKARALWRSVALGSPGDFSGDDLIVPDRAIDVAYSAYSIVKEYGIVLPEKELFLSDETRALKKWMRGYEKRLKKLNCIDMPQMLNEAARLLKSGGLRLDKWPARPGIKHGLVFAGFDVMTPYLKSFIDAAPIQGAGLMFWPSRPLEPFQDAGQPGALEKVNIREYADMKEEVIQAARWARQRLEDGLSRVGFIVPELIAYRDIIKKEFSSELDPASALLLPGRKDVFNISLGRPLFEEPLVRSAIGLISTGKEKEDIRGIFNAISSPFFASVEDYLSLGALDAHMRERNILKASLKDIKDGLGRINALTLGNRIDGWLKILKNAESKMLPGEWARFFSGLLKTVGFLSRIKLSSREYQALKAWNEVLGDFAGLDDALGAIKKDEAASVLKRLAVEAVHQPETPDSPIEVLGMLEAVGQRFDALWIMGAHEYALPKEPAPNPFIPPNIQRELNVPHSSHELELWFSKAILGRVLSQAGSVEASYPALVDQRAVRLTPILRDKHVAIEDIPLMQGSGRLKDRLFGLRLGLEPLPSEENIPVEEQELKIIKGGTTIIKDQSLCPFKAFASHRLNAIGVNTPVFGVSDKDRGSIIHLALKAFWEGLGDLESLKKMNEEKRTRAFIEAIVDKVLNELNAKKRISAGPGLLEIERERLKELLFYWASFESTRTSFRVKAVELSREINIKGLVIRGRIDRIDELPDGREVVLDYKSGRVDRKDWLGQRPKDPQLLIYSLAGEYDAISFARVSPDECGFIGLSSGQDLLPGIMEFEKDRMREKFSPAADWRGLIDGWRNIVERLASEFLSGVSAVDPATGVLAHRSRISVCSHCELNLLCRVFEAERTEEDISEDEENGD
ncbi:MAG: PD-(D/E)XK nuclease family protein [Deltaproteobacteria bacterium]